MSTYQTEAEFQAVVNGFESCTTDKTEFKHQDHLIVAVFYLDSLPLEKAIQRMRAALLRFVDHHQVDRKKYNETITVLWFELVAEHLASMDQQSSLVDRCNSVIEAYGSGAVVFEYYSKEQLFSEGARQKFVEPDLKHWRKC